MKIDELVGYKNKPEYKAATASLDMYELRDKLKELGYEKYELGSGLYASVYARPEDNYVLKVFREDEGYRTFMKFVAANRDNPYIPKVRGKPVKIPGTEGYYLVRLEKLTPISEELFNNIAVTIWPNKMFPNAAPLARKMLNEKFPGFLKLLNDVKTNAEGKGVHLDLHPGNIMMRGDTPVITDPYAY